MMLKQVFINVALVPRETDWFRKQVHKFSICLSYTSVNQAHTQRGVESDPRYKTKRRPGLGGLLICWSTLVPQRELQSNTLYVGLMVLCQLFEVKVDVRAGATDPAI